MRHYRILSLLLGGLLVVASGCTSRKPLQAIVTLDGKPVEGATVVLVKAGGGAAISGFTAADGTLTLDSSSKDGIPPGDYKVVVTKVKAGSGGTIDPKNPEAMKMMMKGSAIAKSELPEKYGTAATSPLVLKVPLERSPAKIELKIAP